MNTVWTEIIKMLEQGNFSVISTGVTEPWQDEWWMRQSCFESPPLSHFWSREWRYKSAACGPPELLHHTASVWRHQHRMSPNTPAGRPPDELLWQELWSKTKTSTRFALISLSQAEWDNKMESRGGLGFFEYESSFIHEGGYLSSDRAEGPASSQPGCLSTDTLACWWLMQREMMSDSVILLGIGRYLCQQVLNWNFHIMKLHVRLKK